MSSLGDPAHRAIGGDLDPYATMLAWVAVTLAALGYLDQAQLRVNDVLSEARRLSHAQTLADVLSCAMWVELMTRSPEVQQHAEELMALSTEHGFAWYLGHATVIRGLLLTARGQAREGLSLLTEGLTVKQISNLLQETDAKPTRGFPG